MNLPRVFSDYLLFILCNLLHKAFAIFPFLLVILWVICILKLGININEWWTVLLMQKSLALMQCRCLYEATLGICAVTRGWLQVSWAQTCRLVQMRHQGLHPGLLSHQTRAFLPLVYLFVLSISYCIYFCSLSVSFFCIILKGSYLNIWIYSGSWIKCAFF